MSFDREYRQAVQEIRRSLVKLKEQLEDKDNLLGAELFGGYKKYIDKLDYVLKETEQKLTDEIRKRPIEQDVVYDFYEEKWIRKSEQIIKQKKGG